ncbi:GNAT family N-acetyltransferase [Paludisphaera soli]|uniref:GNAT family N-acetyltransferase n=1 Tax=Paludisphaera soli TaxID=2712865 RepID=UPI0013EC61DD|nr:GNAT family N-acetyltransferase [Paludisphaera soli]
MQATSRGLSAAPPHRLPAPSVKPLAWDSAHFGGVVGRIVADEPEGLARALAAARRDGYSLVYIFSPPDFAMPAALLAEFDGLKVDDRVVFAADLDASEAPTPVPDSFAVVEAPRGEPSPGLVELAVAAGACSRFGVDPRIPVEAFRRLYEIWIARSCRRETADAVFVAEGRDAPDDPLGLVTASVRGDAATIGLVAVGAHARRRGVGRAMLHHAHSWLAAQGVRRVEVATQLANEPACSLYRACGYRPAVRETIHHFRPRPAASA